MGTDGCVDVRSERPRVSISERGLEGGEQQYVWLGWAMDLTWTGIKLKAPCGVSGCQVTLGQKILS